MSSNKLHPQNATQPNYQRQLGRTLSFTVKCLLIAIGFTYFFTRYFEVQVSIQPRHTSNFSHDEPRLERCKPDLPAKLALIKPISPANRNFKLAAETIHQTLQETAANEDIDSLVLGIVGPECLLWWNGYGLEKANDTTSTQPPGIHTIYRIASISKLFATMETYILRDRGLLSWDDPVTKYFPNFTYRQPGWKEYLASNTTNDPRMEQSDPITLRQLAGYMSGIGRDYPSENRLRKSGRLA